MYFPLHGQIGAQAMQESDSQFPFILFRFYHGIGAYQLFFFFTVKQW